MNENSIIEMIKGVGNGVISSAINAISGALITTLFLKKNTNSEEFAKIKAAKFKEVTDKLLDSGKMSYFEYYKCNNFLKIAKKADEMNLSLSETPLTAKEYDFDWFVHFYENASCVSNEQLQNLWASVLTREVNQPGTVSLMLLNSLSMMNMEQAQSFCNISRYAMNDINYYPNLLLFISKNREAYERERVTVNQIKTLERLGLVDCDWENEFVFLNKKTFIAGNKSIDVFGDGANDGKIKAGNVKFTKDGADLYGIIDNDYKLYNPKIVEFTISRFKLRNCRININPQDV